MIISIAVNSSSQLSNRMARPSSSSASASAFSWERFETRTLLAPRLLSARAAFSLVSPAPMTSTCCDLSESKIDPANSTATELTEMLPR